MSRLAKHMNEPAGRAIDRRRVLAAAAALALGWREMPAAGADTERGAMSMAIQTEDVATSGYLDGEGARLYYEVSGTGPTLLLIPGGPVDADGWKPIVGLLEDQYTVVRYDPRGISRSRFEPLETVSVETHADDAARLLQFISTEPACVLGHSGGGVIGLALVVRHSELVHTYIAHEPPLTNLLAPDDPRRQEGQAIYETYLSEGVGPAMGRFMASAGMEGEDGPPSEMGAEAEAVIAEAMARTEENLDFFLGHYLIPITSYEPDFAALKAAATRIEAGVGEASVGQETYDTGVALAERLGTEPIVFPGDHVGMATHPEEFAERLAQVFGAS